MDLIKSEFPKAASPDELQSIKDGIFKIEKGVISISINEKKYTAKQISLIIGESYYRRNEKAEKFLSEIAENLFFYNIFM